MYTDRRGRFSLSSAKILMSLLGQDFGRVSNNFNAKVAQECTWIRSTISCSLRKCWKLQKKNSELPLPLGRMIQSKDS